MFNKLNNLVGDGTRGSPVNIGGIPYGLPNFPTSLGSGGGNANSLGGSGGGAKKHVHQYCQLTTFVGATHLIVSGNIRVDGSLAANGAAGAFNNGYHGKTLHYLFKKNLILIYFFAGGGGSGGSIWIECVSLLGSGIISSNGGLGWHQHCFDLY